MPPAAAKVKQLSHTQIAQRYIRDHTPDTIFAQGRWYRWDLGLWNPHHDLSFSREVWKLLEFFELQRRCRPTLGAKNAVIDRVKAEVFIKEENMDSNDNLINLQNGVYDMRDGKLYPHKQEYYMTTQLPFLYDENAKAPMWELYLASTFVKPKTTDTDQDLIDFVQEAMGYSLTTSVSHHVTFWCTGEGSNGKGVLFHTLEKLAGESAMSLNVGLLRREQYQLAMLAGKRIAMCSESGSTENLVKDDLIKALVAGDTMNVRMIKQPPFMLHPKCKLWWSMNSLPAVADSSTGFWRRIRLIPFNREFTDADKILDLKERLVAELPGIFNWVMIGLRRLNDRGKFKLPDQVELKTKEYQKESNPVEMFVEDECYTEKDENLAGLISVVYTSYKSWCFENGYRNVSSRKFKNEMARLKYFVKKVHKGTVYLEIGLKSMP